MKTETFNDSGHQALHLWFGLSYAEYLTIPRSVLQSMPDEWQATMARLLSELDNTIDWHPEKGCYRVILQDYGYSFDKGEGVEKFKWVGPYLDDPLGDYQKGRRRVPHIARQLFQKEGA